MFDKDQLQRGGHPRGQHPNVPPVRGATHPFPILQEPRSRSQSWPQGIWGKQWTAGLTLVTSPANIIVTHLELGAMPAHPPLLFLCSVQS